jgi:hypothetical protein
MKVKEEKSINEFQLMVYEKGCNDFTIKLLWLWVFIQAIGFFVFLLYREMFPINSSYEFLLNILLFTLSALTVNFLKKRYHSIKSFQFIKYVIISLIFVLATVLVLTYKNDIAMQFVWIMPVAMSVLYLDRKIMFYAIANAFAGLIIMEFIMPVEKYHTYSFDMHVTSLMFFVIFCIIFYLLSRHMEKIKSGVDNTLSSVIYGTKTINHSLKNQINTVNIYIENYKKIFEEKGINPEGLLIIEEATKHLNDMINRIQTYLKNPILEKSLVNLPEILDSCLDFFDARLKRKNVTVIKEYPNETFVSCDSILIKEVFNNLILNAIEAFNKDDNRLTIHVYKSSKDVRIDLTDNGCGIPKDVLPRIIDPHFSTKDRNNNFGLGLTYCFRIIKEHNGFFDVVETEVNKGTKIEVVLPLS